MSDQHRPYGNSAFEPEDMSIFFHNLLECTPAAVTVATGGDSAVLDYRSSGASLNFSDPACFFDSEAKEGAEKAFSSTVSGDCDAVTSSIKREDFTIADKATSNRVQSSSSKRSRSSEVHNMSEKRRRSRINEKLKALQSLIPNSNKTDKASMLDEAIEYLKQLQFQVQILTIRNGLSLHPNYAPGSMPSMQLPIGFDAGNVLPYTDRTAETLSGNQQVVMQTVFGSHNLKVPGHQLAVPSQPQKLTTNNNPGTSFGEESSLPSHFGIINQLTSAKDLCREEKLPHLQLDVSCSGNNSSSGVSS